MFTRCLLALGGLLFAMSAAAQEPAPPFNTPIQAPESITSVVKVELFTKDVPIPLFLTAAPGDTTGRIFIVSKKGKIYIHKNGAVDKTKPFLDITDEIKWGYEQGLLGMAFHPKYQSNGLLYIHMTNLKGFTRVVEYKVSKDDPDLVDESTAREILLLDGQALPGAQRSSPTIRPRRKALHRDRRRRLRQQTKHGSK